MAQYTAARLLDWSEPNLESLTETLLQRDSDLAARVDPLGAGLRSNPAERNARPAAQSYRELRLRAESSTAENDVFQETVARYEEEALAHSADLAVLRTELGSKKARNALSRDVADVLAALSVETKQALEVARATHPLTPSPSAALPNDAKTFASSPNDRTVDKAHQPDKSLCVSRSLF
ncbi:hypothetical protein FRB90_004749 [Tulasnella sp. 427]|nr:hypothetical protein FRB90_004749 [Tulasnella sp. 427]